MPLLSHNITSNARYFTQPPDVPQPLALDWDGERLPEQVVQAGGFGAILYVPSYVRERTTSPASILTRSFSTRMADVTYNTASFPSLLRTLSSLVRLNAKNSRPPPLVILGYKERDSDERSLWGMLASDVGVRLEKVGECEGWPESTPVEFWVGRVKSPPLP
jgi:hypothetical protein